MFDQVVIGVCAIIICDPLQTLEKVSGFDLHEAVDAHIADIGGMSSHSVPDIAMLLDLFATGATVEHFAHLDPNKIPFCASGIEVVRDGKRQDVRL